MLDLKYFRELLRPEFGDLQRAAVAATFKPSMVQAKSKKKRTETASHVITPLAPVQTGPAEWSPAFRKQVDFQPKFVKEVHSPSRDLRSFGLENNKAARRKRVGQSDAQTSREMVVTASCSS